MVIGTIILGLALFFGLTYAPTRLKRPIVMTFTFLSGLFYVLLWLVPTPLKPKEPGELPLNPVDAAGIWFSDALPRVADVAQILSAFLLGLGIFSLLTIHIRKINRKQTDWGFSIVLLVSMVLMLGFGYADWIMKEFRDPLGLLQDSSNWTFVNQMSDLLFDGILQQMDAAMFSLIAFYILSAAYRAFRVRSVESTVLMASALILMLSLMGGVAYAWGQGIDALVIGTGNEFLNNLKITEVANWLRTNMQAPAIRAIEFGVGLGALAMGIRIWLGLERGGVSA
jgi:hypothetical protein